LKHSWHDIAYLCWKCH